MPCVPEGEFHAGQHLEGLAIADAVERGQHRFRIRPREKRCDCAPAATAPALARRTFRVVRGNRGAVKQQDARKVATGCGCENRPAETALVKQWQPTAMIDVRVAQDNRVDFRRVERKRLAVSLAVRYTALYEPAVEQDAVATDLDDVTGPGDLSGCTEELQVHRRLRRSAFRPGPPASLAREESARRP